MQVDFEKIQFWHLTMSHEYEVQVPFMLEYEPEQFENL